MHPMPAIKPKFHMEVEHEVLDKENSKVGSFWWTFKLPIPVCQFLSWFRVCAIFLNNIGFETPKYSISWGPKAGKIVSKKISMSTVHLVYTFL